MVFGLVVRGFTAVPEGVADLAEVAVGAFPGVSPIGGFSPGIISSTGVTRIVAGGVAAGAAESAGGFAACVVCVEGIVVSEFASDVEPSAT